MNEITLDDGFFNPYPKMKFSTKEEAKTFWRIMFDCEGGMMELTFSLFDFAGNKPKTSFTKHENAFHLIYPYLERQVTFGLGKGAYKKYAVEEPTAKDVLENLSELVQAEFETPITIDDFQDLVSTQVSQLIEILGLDI